MISIVMPNYNKADCISSAIESVQSQTYSDWELIVVDDGSTDNSLEVIDRYVASDKRIHLKIRDSETGGGSACRNIGYRLSSGEYIIFFDSDDLLLPHALAQRVAYMDSNPTLDFVVFPIQKFYHDPGDCDIQWPLPRNNYLRRFLKHKLPWQTMQPIWKRHVIEELDGFDEQYSRLQDVEFHTRALLSNDIRYSVQHNLAPDCCYRIIVERPSDDQARLLSLLVENCSRYLEKTSALMPESDAEKCADRKYLNGAVFAITRKILLSETEGKIERAHADTLLDKLYSGRLASSSIPPWLRALYTRLHRLGLDKMKGIHYFFRHAFIFLSR